MKSTCRLYISVLFVLNGFQLMGQIPDSILQVNQALIESDGGPSRVTSIQARNYDVYNLIVKRMAEYDVANHNIWLVHKSNYFLEAKDSAYQKKYNLKYYSGKTGCLILPSKAFETYNKVVFKYLDRKYGKVWLKELSKTNVCGIKAESQK